MAFFITILRIEFLNNNIHRVNIRFSNKYKMNLEFTIKNIKGYGDPAIVRSIDVLPRKINLVYAPNGSGKSTLTAALRNLERGGLNVPKYDRYKKSENVVCKLQ